MFGGPSGLLFFVGARSGKKEMTLDEFRFRFFSSRVISVLSYYLTSLVTSIFYSDEQIPYWTSISLLFRLVSYLLDLAFPLLPHIRISAFAVSCRLLRIQSNAFCVFVQLDAWNVVWLASFRFHLFGINFAIGLFSDLRSAFWGFCCLLVFCCVWLPGCCQVQVWQLLF